MSDEAEIDYDDGHGNGENCYWSLQCDVGSPTITFNTFQTESNFDYVNIFDGVTTSDPQVAELHGSAVPDPVTVSGSSAVLQFTSDGSVTSDGFHATFECTVATVEATYIGCFGDGCCVSPITLLICFMAVSRWSSIDWCRFS